MGDSTPRRFRGHVEKSMCAIVVAVAGMILLTEFTLYRKCNEVRVQGRWCEVPLQTNGVLHNGHWTFEAPVGPRKFGQSAECFYMCRSWICAHWSLLYAGCFLRNGTESSKDSDSSAGIRYEL